MIRLGIFVFGIVFYCSSSLAAYELTDIYPTISFKRPVAAVPHPLDNKHWIVLEQRGHVYSTAADKKTLLAKLGDRVSSGGEKGLLGIAFHPQFPKQAYVFLSYTGKQNGELTSFVSRFKLDPGSLIIDTDSESIVIQVEQPYGNHNGGQISFGPDGYLYIGWGDGGSGGDPKGHGQNTQTLLGNMLRIDVSKLPYRIPKDNPFVDKKQYRPEIYAFGLRNPWRWSFDQQTGDLWLADVGQNKIEEINIIKAGGNYGWNIMEGDQCYNPRSCVHAGLVMPVFTYTHEQGESITGGYVYHGTDKSLKGRYVYGDFIAGKIWALNNKRDQAELLWSGEHNISSFAQNPTGEVFILSYFKGKILRLDKQ